VLAARWGEAAFVWVVQPLFYNPMFTFTAVLL
jgi:hypothetical protein